jgi:hypothetical protein
VQPIDDRDLPQEMGLEVSPLRTRTLARAQYRLPRVARLQVEPQTRWLGVTEDRLVQR